MIHNIRTCKVKITSYQSGLHFVKIASLYIYTFNCKLIYGVHIVICLSYIAK